MIPAKFIALLKDAAVASMHETGIPASAVIAQAALESAWGESGLAKSAMNLFGVKADKGWTGPVITMQTREFISGKWVVVPAKWRKYPTWLACLNDHANFFKVNRRYAAALTCRDGPSFAKAIAQAGYATDPRYAEKLCSVIAAHNLTQYDLL